MTKYRGLDRLIRMGVLSNIQLIENGVSPQSAADKMIDGLPEGAHVKNVCAKMSTHLVERLDAAIATVGCSKRRFIESAILAALDRVEEIAHEEGLDEVMEARHADA